MTLVEDIVSGKIHNVVWAIWSQEQKFGHSQSLSVLQSFGDGYSKGLLLLAEMCEDVSLSHVAIRSSRSSELTAGILIGSGTVTKGWALLISRSPLSTRSRFLFQVRTENKISQKLEPSVEPVPG